MQTWRKYLATVASDELGKKTRAFFGCIWFHGTKHKYVGRKNRSICLGCEWIICCVNEYPKKRAEHLKGRYLCIDSLKFMDECELVESGMLSSIAHNHRYHQRTHWIWFRIRKFNEWCQTQQEMNTVNIILRFSRRKEKLGTHKIMRDGSNICVTIAKPKGSMFFTHIYICTTF